MSETGRGLVCMFCGEGFGYEGSTPDEATLKAAVAHEKECPKNPYKAEIALYKGLLESEQSDCELQRKNKLANWERVQNLERYVHQLHHQIEELYLVRIEPDKMLCMIERLRQQVKVAESV